MPVFYISAFTKGGVELVASEIRAPTEGGANNRATLTCRGQVNGQPRTREAAAFRRRPNATTPPPRLAVSARRA
jgi:hypothetical protein